MNVPSINSPSFRSYFCNVGAKGKVLRVALPILTFTAVCVGLVYYMRNRATSIASLLFDPVHFPPSTAKIDGYSSDTHKIPLSQVYPGTFLDYILANNPYTDSQVSDFIELITDKAGIVISFGNTSWDSIKSGISQGCQITLAEKYEKNCLQRCYTFSDTNNKINR